MMTKKKISRRILVLMICFLSLGIWVCNGMNSSAQVSKIRVGVFKLTGFYEWNEKGELGGYGIDYLEKIAELTGWEYNYIWADNWEECVELLKEGKVDIIAPAEKTEEWLEEFSYSNYNIGMERGALITLDTNEQLVYEDYEAFDNIKIGCVDSQVFNEDFIVYAENYGFTPNFVSYGDTGEVMRALRTGEVDAVLVNLFVKTDEMKILAKLGSHPFYFMMNRENDSLMEKLNEALQIVKSDYVDIEEELLKYYYPSFNYVPFSRSELEYIEQVPVLRVACRSNMKPISFVNDETGEIEGIDRDILDRISEISGLQFEYVALPEGDITYDLLKELGISLISTVEYNQENSRVSSLHLTNPYLDSQKVFVCKGQENFDSDQKMRVAVSTGSQTLEAAIYRMYPNFEVIKYNNIAECFEAVRAGKADALLQNQYVVLSYLSKPLYEDMVTVPVESMEDRFCLSPVFYGLDGEDKGYLLDKRLISVLNKSIQQVEKEEISKIVFEQTTNNRYSYTFGDFFYQYRFTILTISVILAILAVLVAVIIVMHRRNVKAARESERKHEILLNNSGNIMFEIDCLNKCIKISDMFEEKFGWNIRSNQAFHDIHDVQEMLKCYKEDRTEIDNVLSRLVEKKCNTETQVRIMKTDGNCLWCRISLYPMNNEKGTMIYIMGRILDIDKEIREKEALMQESRVDSFTGLLNKTTFFKETEEQLKAAEGGSALIFIDVDNFKQVNDNLGHMIGDDVIRDTAEKLKNIFSGKGMLSRFGGDEFCIYVNPVSEKELEKDLICIVKRLQAVYRSEGKEVFCSASVGAVYTWGGGKNLEELIEKADRALYQSKEKGKNQYNIYYDSQ